MTSIIIWSGADQRGPASIYVASDSRITWGETEDRWDHGRKVFACSKSPHLFGYCGDVVFPALILPIIIDRIDAGMLGSDSPSWHQSAYELIRQAWASYPKSRGDTFQIVHAFRQDSGMPATFSLAEFAFSASKNRWKQSVIDVPSTSALLFAGGTGAKAVREAHQLWASTEAAGTSRAVFSGFVEALMSGSDPKSGGPPQLCGIYRIGNAFSVGVWYKRKRYFSGMPLAADQISDVVEWRNHLFERVRGKDGKLLAGAKKHQPRA